MPEKDIDSKFLCIKFHHNRSKTLGWVTGQPRQKLHFVFISLEPRLNRYGVMNRSIIILVLLQIYIIGWTRIAKTSLYVSSLTVERRQSKAYACAVVLQMCTHPVEMKNEKGNSFVIIILITYP